MESMRASIGQHIRGENNPVLRSAMRTLARDPSPRQVDEALLSLAAVRGRSVNELRAEFCQYRQLTFEAAARGFTAEPLNEAGRGVTSHPTFMGSTNQLRSGKVVGDVLGVDAVFGALLNPTGGLIGPGNLGVDGGESALSYHAIFHDAAGYLYKAHHIGPGYDYLNPQPGESSNPLAGHRRALVWVKFTAVGSVSVQRMRIAG